jgi:arsenate reductase
MAEGFLKVMNPALEVYSAGTEPGEKVHPVAIEVMKEEGIDLSKGYPKPVEIFINTPFDYVITVCDSARENCPIFAGEVKHRLHIGFDDPAEVTGTEAKIKAVFIRVRDEIKRDFTKFYKEKIQNKF